MVYDDVEALWKRLLEAGKLSVWDTTTRGIGGLSLIEKLQD